MRSVKDAKGSAMLLENQGTSIKLQNGNDKFISERKPPQNTYKKTPHISAAALLLTPWYCTSVYVYLLLPS